MPVLPHFFGCVPIHSFRTFVGPIHFRESNFRLSTLRNGHPELTSVFKLISYQLWSLILGTLFQLWSGLTSISYTKMGRKSWKRSKCSKDSLASGKSIWSFKNLCYSNLIFKANGEAQLGKYSGEENAAAAAESLFVANHSY